jgi:hypothetical protein
MVARRSEMSAEWKVRFAICIASVAIQAFTKLLFSFSDVLKTTNCTFQEVDNIFCLAVGIAVYDEFFSCMCAAEFLCALDVFARHTSSRITFLTLTIVGRSRRDVSSHQDVFQTFGFPEGQDFEDFTQFWVFLYIYIYSVPSLDRPSLFCHPYLSSKNSLVERRKDGSIMRMHCTYLY